MGFANLQQIQALPPFLACSCVNFIFVCYCVLQYNNLYFCTFELKPGW